MKVKENKVKADSKLNGSNWNVLVSRPGNGMSKAEDRFHGIAFSFMNDSFENWIKVSGQLRSHDQGAVTIVEFDYYYYDHMYACRETDIHSKFSFVGQTEYSL